MTAATHDFEIEQGATLIKPLVWKDDSGVPRNLTGFAARMQIRKSPSNGIVLFELSTANEKIVIAPIDGKVTLIFSAEDTAEMTWSRGVYDLELIASNGFVTRLLQGMVSVSKEVTRG